MGMHRALVFSFACHLFCFSFFSLRFDLPADSLQDKFSISFLGSVLRISDIYPHGLDKVRVDKRLVYGKSSPPVNNLAAVIYKPTTRWNKISPPKHLSKFLVFEKKPASAEKETTQDRYLATKPDWVRVNLKLKIE